MEKLPKSGGQAHINPFREKYPFLSPLPGFILPPENLLTQYRRHDASKNHDGFSGKITAFMLSDRKKRGNFYGTAERLINPFRKKYPFLPPPPVLTVPVRSGR